MPTNQRSELSQKNKYWIPKFRYLELKNFCFQYPEWKQQLASITEIRAVFPKSSLGNFSNPTEQNALCRDRLESNINLIDSTAKEADSYLAPWIIKGATEGYSFDYLHLQISMPASRDTYYDRYRRFFWLLDQKRD